MAQGPCEVHLDACKADMACSLLIECFKDCNWTGDCIQQCSAIVPSGVPLFQNLADCAACTFCAGYCDGSSLQLLCH